jgi:LuxR family maltose regulon positive regulatory protein
LPDDLIRARPALLMANAWVGQLGARWAGSARWLEAATELMDRNDVALDPSAVEPLLGEIDAMRAFELMLQGDGAGAAATARRALARLPVEHFFVRGGAVIGLGLGLYETGQGETALREFGDLLDAHVGPPDGFSLRVIFTGALIHLQAADLHGLHLWATRLLTQSLHARSVFMMVWAHELLGRVAYEWDDLAAAERHFSAVLAERHRCHLVAVREALIGLTLTHWAHGRGDDAEAALTDLNAFLAEMGGDGFVPMVGSMRTRMALLRGERPVDRWHETTGDLTRQWLCYFEDPQFTRIRAVVAEGTDPEAMSLLTDFLAMAEREHAVPSRIAALAVLAQALQARGDEAGALNCLAEALVLAEPGGFVRAFLDLGEPLVVLLRTLAARRPPSPYLARLLAAAGDTSASRREAAPGEPAPPSGPDADAALPGPEASLSPAWPALASLAARDPALVLVEVLTEREAQVLDLLARHLTNKEIATALSISPLTVKRHVSNLCGKLGARTRREAVAIAAAMGLIVPRPPW